MAACCGFEFDPELVVPDRSKSLADGAVAAWRGATAAADKKHRTQLADFLEKHVFHPQDRTLPPARQRLAPAPPPRTPGACGPRRAGASPR